MKIAFSFERRELFAHEDFGVIDVTRLLEEFPDDGGIIRMSVDEIMSSGSGRHEFDEARLNNFRHDSRGLFVPVLIAYKIEEEKKIATVEIIDGWHRIKVLHERRKKNVVGIGWTFETVRRFVIPEDTLPANHPCRLFLAQRRRA